jgi:serine/threonine protein phosphatase PrpC
MTDSPLPPSGGPPPPGSHPDQGSASGTGSEPGSGPVGSVLAGRYRVVRRLGTGAMGEVFLGEHLRMGRRDAIKLLRAGVARDPEAMARFTRGARNVARIRHPHVCQVYDFGETDDGALFLAMEYVDGGSLGDLLRAEGALPPPLAARFLTEAASALDAAHALGIVHRDLKPDNLMLSRGGDAGPEGGAASGPGRIKVVDFDIARGPAEEEGAGVTRHGFVVGTPEYMSPEQLTGDPLDARSDVYALALILVRMLTGRLPFPGTTAQEVMLQRLTEDPATLASLLPEGTSLPPALEAVVQRGLARRVEDRTPSAGSLAREVNQALEMAGGTRPGTDLEEDSGATGVVPPAPNPAPGVADPVAYAAPPPHPGGAHEPPPPDATRVVDPPLVHATVPQARGKRGVLAGASAAALLLVAGGIWWAMERGTASDGTPPAAGAPGTAATLEEEADAPDAPADAVSPGGAGASEVSDQATPPGQGADGSSGATGTGASGAAPTGGAPSSAATPPPSPATGAAAGAAGISLGIPPGQAHALLIRQFGAQDDTDGPVAPSVHRAVRDTTLAVWNLSGISRPDSALAAHILGISLVALGDRDEGLQWLDRAVQVQPLERYSAVRDARGRGIRVRLAGLTHVGLVRRENQDLFFAGPFPSPNASHDAAAGEVPGEGREGGASLQALSVGPDLPARPDGSDPSFLLGPLGALAVVADGMGGPGGGARASRVAVSALVEALEGAWVPTRTPTPGAFARALETAVRNANRVVHQEAVANAGLQGMGTTLTLAGILGDTAYLVQVGDSRAYLLREGVLRQLTRDQSLVQEMVDRGVLTPEAAARSAQRNVILQALGPEPTLNLFTEFVTLRQGDLLLLCSDGLSGYADHSTLQTLVGAEGSLAARANRLVHAALEGGGEDNVTVVLVEVTGEGLLTPGGSSPPTPHRVPPDAP